MVGVLIMKSNAYYRLGKPLWPPGTSLVQLRPPIYTLQYFFQVFRNRYLVFNRGSFDIAEIFRDFHRLPFETKVDSLEMFIVVTGALVPSRTHLLMFPFFPTLIWVHENNRYFPGLPGGLEVWVHQLTLDIRNELERLRAFQRRKTLIAPVSLKVEGS